MRIQLTATFLVTDAEGKPISDAELLRQLARESSEDLRIRMFGQGFLPADLTVGDYAITSKIILEETN